MTLEEMRLRVAVVSPDGHVTETNHGAWVGFGIGKRGLAEVIWEDGAWWTWALNRSEDAKELAAAIEGVTAHQIVAVRRRLTLSREAA